MSEYRPALPDGKTCNDCRWFEEKCRWFIRREGSEIECDWHPSRFAPTHEEEDAP